MYPINKTISEESEMNILSIFIPGGSWITTFLSSCLLIFLTVLVVERRKFLHALKKVPHPPALPIIGNAYQLNCTPKGKFLH